MIARLSVLGLGLLLLSGCVVRPWHHDDDGYRRPRHQRGHDDRRHHDHGRWGDRDDRRYHDDDDD